MRSASLFLVADDLTGALDSAAPFARPDGPVSVHWRQPDARVEGSLAIDSGTRECDPETAGARLAALLADRRPGRERLCYAKLDSLLRGNAAAEIAAWMAAFAPRRCVIAPAFPQQDRRTLAGRQHFLRDGQWVATARDLLADLKGRGFEVALCDPGAPIPDGLSFWNAASDADLAAIVAADGADDPSTLWCGSGGLARALAGRTETSACVEGFPAPMIGLFGTDHPVTQRQIEACAPFVVEVADGEPTHGDAVRERLSRHQRAVIRPRLPAGIDRADAARRIDRLFADLLDGLERPGTLVVAGGETLRGLCLALGADRLEIDGEITPGVPISRLRGGRFDGVRVVSKSGAFGAPDFLQRLFSGVAASQS